MLFRSCTPCQQRAFFSADQSRHGKSLLSIDGFARTSAPSSRHGFRKVDALRQSVRSEPAVLNRVWSGVPCRFSSAGCMGCAAASRRAWRVQAQLAAGERDEQAMRYQAALAENAHLRAEVRDRNQASRGRNSVTASRALQHSAWPIESISSCSSQCNRIRRTAVLGGLKCFICSASASMHRLSQGVRWLDRAMGCRWRSCAPTPSLRRKLGTRLTVRSTDHQVTSVSRGRMQRIAKCRGRALCTLQTTKL